MNTAHWATGVTVEVDMLLRLIPSPGRQIPPSTVELAAAFRLPHGVACHGVVVESVVLMLRYSSLPNVADPSVWTAVRLLDTEYIVVFQFMFL